MKTHGGSVESPFFRVLNFEQADQPALGGDQQTGRLLAWCEIEDDTADHPLGIVVGPGSPDLGLAAELECEVDQAVFEILDAREIGHLTAIVNRDAHVQQVLEARLAVG